MIFFIILGVAIIATVLGLIFDKMLYWTTSAVFKCIAVVSWIIGLALTITIIINHLGIDAEIAENQQTYESLVYQAENNLYDNDNDFGKKELMDEIRDWNEDLAFYKEAQRDFWIGIFIPNAFDEFEFISYDMIT